MSEPRPSRPKPSTTLAHLPPGAQRLRRMARRRARLVIRWLKIGAWMLASAIVIPAAMIAGGLLLGPRGYEGVFLTPLAVCAAWAVILYVGLRKRPTRRKIAHSDVQALPAQVEEWLERQRTALPAEALPYLDRIGNYLETMDLQVQSMAPDSPLATQVRRLLIHDLTDLVNGYRKLPEPLRHQPLHGGSTPEAQLLSGLATVDTELARLRDRLAADDLHSLATHQRYLELKYKNETEGD